MVDDLPSGAGGAEGPGSDGQIPALPKDLTTEEQEVRRLVEAGAASPEELRALAARLEAKRTREEALWRRDVRPALMQAKKRRFSAVELREETTERSKGLGLALVLLAVVLLLLLIATQTSVIWLLIPVVGVLVYAWKLGRGDEPPNESPTVPDAAD